MTADYANRRTVHTLAGVRAELEERRQRRVERRQFRRDLKSYLEALENKLIQSPLPI
jgi:hypothetical protein